LKVLLTGRDGQVGSELQNLLPALGELVATGRAELDLADADAIRKAVRAAKPALIVNAAAYNAVDRAEAEPDAAMRVNGAAPEVLAEEAKRLGALLVHYSTDYVFDGGKRTPYVEDDAPRPLGRYGASKLAGERAVLASGCAHLVLRTSWVYGPRATNFYRIIHAKARADEAMLMVDDQASVPTSSAFLAAHTVALLELGARGLLHLVPSGAATRCDFAREVVRLMGSRSSVQPAKSSQFPSPARRPAYSVLSNARAADTLGPRKICDWKEDLAACLARGLD
jgi:dTDP-4-dehydrorhamnose reductase